MPQACFICQVSGHNRVTCTALQDAETNIQKKDNNLYDAIDAGRHNNDEEIVLLLKVPEDIEIDECCGDG